MSIGEGIVRNAKILLWLPLIFIELGNGQRLNAVTLFPIMSILEAVGVLLLTYCSYSLICLS